jgi:hypothetical protein
MHTLYTMCVRRCNTYTHLFWKQIRTRRTKNQKYIIFAWLIWTRNFYDNIYTMIDFYTPFFIKKFACFWHIFWLNFRSTNTGYVLPIFFFFWLSLPLSLLFASVWSTELFGRCFLCFHFRWKTFWRHRSWMNSNPPQFNTYKYKFSTSFAK